MDRTLSGATTTGQSERVPHIPQSSSITEALPSDGSVSYPGHSLLAGSYPSGEMQSLYSTAATNWASNLWEFIILI